MKTIHFSENCHLFVISKRLLHLVIEEQNVILEKFLFAHHQDFIYEIPKYSD